MLARRPHRVRLYIPQCIVDRGKYDMEMFDQFLTLRGQSYNYKIPYSTVSRLFLLPRPGQTMISFVISVNPPIRQGKTGYQHLITTFPAHDEISVNLNISDEVLASEYNGKLEKEMSGPTYEVLTKVFKVLSGKRMSIPKGFRSSRGDSCVRCAVGNQDGLLYVLDKSFMFVNKPATNLRFDDVEHVEFDRTSQEVERRALKSWDLMVVMRAGTKHTFANVERNDYDPLVAFLKGQGVKLIGAQDQTQQQTVGDDEFDDDNEDEEEDEDFDGADADESSDSESDDDDDDDDGGGGGGGNDDDTSSASSRKGKTKSRASSSPKRKRDVKLKHGEVISLFADTPV